MKTKTSKFNILLMAIVLLLVFVAGVKCIGSTGSWLKDSDQVGFEVNVANINIIVKQGERVIDNNGNIYLGTSMIEAEKQYVLDITVNNDENDIGFFVRCRVIAMINGVAYNLNKCITGDFYKDDDGWMYHTEDVDSPAHTQMPQTSSKTVIDTITFPASIVTAAKGKFVKLYLYIQGNMKDNFTEEA